MFTPGPWEIDDRLKDDPHYPKGGYEIRAADGTAITGWGSVTQSKDNANLIVAAPDMYKALEAAYDDAANDCVPDPILLKSVLDKVRRR